MPVTIKVNGTVNSLVHKGSTGISMATIPDVCKTPSPAGPIPIPYPNIAQSSMLAKGTTTVKVDGGMMAAIKGSEFSMSNGDEAGTAGGVKSSTFIKEATWILYSFDVKLDGKEACRFMDKMFHNHENTVNMGGVINPPCPVICAELDQEMEKAREEIKDEKMKAHTVVTADHKGEKFKSCSQAKIGKKYEGWSQGKAPDRFDRTSSVPGYKYRPSKHAADYPCSHAEARILEDLWSREPPPQGVIHIKISWKSSAGEQNIPCKNCRKLIRASNENGLVVKKCP